MSGTFECQCETSASAARRAARSRELPVAWLAGDAQPKHHVAPLVSWPPAVGLRQGLIRLQRGAGMVAATLIEKVADL